MLDLDVMLGERQSRVLGFDRGCELFFMHNILAMPAVPQRQTPVAGMLLHGKFDVIILRFVAVPQRHEYSIEEASFSRVAALRIAKRLSAAAPRWREYNA
jgi:hypothetical protein